MMQILPLNQADHQKVKEFLLPYESACIRLCELVKKQSPEVYVIFSDQKITGLVGTGKIITHCIPSPSAETGNLILPLLNEKDVFSVNGERSGTDFIVSLLAKKGRTLSYRYDYILMEKRSGIFEKDYAPLSGGEEIVPCTTDSLDELTELQKDYLNVEVAPPGEKVSPSYVHATLLQHLKSQTVLAVEVDGHFEAKANTSGCGWNFVQIGGVFTSLRFRRYGFARALMAALCNRILRAGKYASLFVKEKNSAAQNLYSSMGFSKAGLWSIAYY